MRARLSPGPGPATRSEEQALALIGLIYDAAGNSSLWPRFLREFGKALRAPATNIFAQDLDNHAFNVAAQVGIDPSYDDAYDRYYHTKNIYLIRGQHLLRSGNVVPSQSLCSDAEALRSEFYNEWIVPQKQSYGLIGVISRNRSLTSMAGAIRFRGMPPFGEEELALVRLLIPHLQRAVQLHRRIADIEARHRGASDALDRWQLGMVLVDACGRIVFMNRSASEIVRARDGLASEADGLHAALTHETVALRGLIQGAMQTSAGLGLQSGGAITLSRPSLKRPLNVLVTPLAPHDSLAAHKRAAAILFVRDPEACGDADQGVLQRFYGLTAAEAALAMLLIAGHNLASAADGLGVTMNTARTHLKRIFEKTGTKRQAELVGLVLRSPAQVRSYHPNG
jgi:DNA-binding CsgD family transcriptional regulator/PAS domain-containing protein